MEIFKNKKNNKGFTLVETMIAVFILTASLAGFFSLIADSLFSARYARNEITANYLLQEAVDYIRNDRDTIAFQSNVEDAWSNFLKKYKEGGCIIDSLESTDNFPNGCYFDASKFSSLPKICDVPPLFGLYRCPVFDYDNNAVENSFYTYSDTGRPSEFKRQVLMAVNPKRGDEVDVKVTVEWRNGNLVRSRSIFISLLNWQK